MNNKETPVRRDMLEVLKRDFGYDAFRPQQAEIIETVLSGKDCLVLMPTGGGKSVCYQIPAVMQEGLTVVISPLIALMKDQVEALAGNGINAAYLNSTLSASEQDSIIWRIRLGELKLLYIAPEKLFSGNIFSNLREWNVSLFAIDESHCISSWGHDFRPEYRQLKNLKLSFPHVPVIALTATADKVTRRDILKQLDIENAPTFITSFDRPNLSLNVQPGRKRLKQIQDFLAAREGQPGIIYCLSRKSTETVAASLLSMGFKADFYHAGSSPEKRSSVQEQFLRDDLHIVVATVAFGMGIDKSNVRWVLHYNLPSNVEGYYQEIGRAGRDGAPSDTLLFYSYQDIITRKDMINNSEQSEEQKQLLHAKLDRMRQYAEADVCRRRVLLSYFNETSEQDCGNCDVCKNPRSRFDGTVIAQKALSGIARTDQKVAMGTLIDILRGSRNRNIIQYGYERLPTFGVGHDLRNEEWVDYIGQLLNTGVIDIAYDEGHTFKLNAVSREVLKGDRKVQLVKFIPLNERKAKQEESAPKERTKHQVIQDELFGRLRKLRKQMADSLSIPPYVIFSDATLSDMAQKKPVSEAQMRAISGVGSEKFRRYGDAFISEILDFARTNTKPGTRIVTGLTYLETLELFRQNLTVEQIARKRDLSPATIISHLLKLKDDGEDIHIRSLIDIRSYEEIVKAAREMQVGKNSPLKPLFELLNEKYNYEQIKLALIIAEEDE